MYKHLTHHQVYYIWLNCVENLIKMKVNDVANKLGKHRSTIYRAIKYIKKINWDPTQFTDKLRKRKKEAFTWISKKIKNYIIEKLQIGWSPEIISGRMKRDISGKIISFKTIYRYIWEDKANGGTLYKLLPHRGKKYKYSHSKRSNIPNRIDIKDRPKIVDKKLRIGDFEGDTIVGIRGGDRACLLTLVDRKSKFAIIRKIPNKTAIAVEKAMNNCYDNTTLPMITITYDNGTEFTNHQNIANTLGCNIYFATPYRSCERGLNEHTNGKIRYFFPKKTDFGKISDHEVSYVQNLLNDRPRKSLNFLTPNEFVNNYLTRTYKKYRKIVAT
jgi:IS30 family transposase